MSDEVGILNIDLDPDLDIVEITTTDGKILIKTTMQQGNRRRLIFAAPKKIKIKRVGRNTNGR